MKALKSIKKKIERKWQKYLNDGETAKERLRMIEEIQQEFRYYQILREEQREQEQILQEN